MLMRTDFHKVLQGYSSIPSVVSILFTTQATFYIYIISGARSGLQVYRQAIEVTGRDDRSTHCVVLDAMPSS
jgi:hypothetical protein